MGSSQDRDFSHRVAKTTGASSFGSRLSSARRRNSLDSPQRMKLISQRSHFSNAEFEAADRA
jgi:hypothetical protein